MKFLLRTLSEAILVALLSALLLLGIRAFLLLSTVLLVGIWGFRLLRKSRTAIVAAGLISAAELVVVLAWLWPITASAVFSQHPLDLKAKVFPPTVENVVMPFLWVGVFVCIGVATWRGFVANRRAGGRVAMRRLAPWTVARLVLLSAACYFGGLRRMPRDLFNVESVSPNGRWAARLVPMDCLIDRNGLVIVRPTGAFWWRPVARLGDILTECDQVRFEWKADSSGFTLLGHHRRRGDERLLEHELKPTAERTPSDRVQGLRAPP